MQYTVEADIFVGIKFRFFLHQIFGICIGQIAASEWCLRSLGSVNLQYWEL